MKNVFTEKAFKKRTEEELDLRFLFGANLYRLRKKLGISQGELSLKWGLSQSAVSRLEAGQNVTLRTIAYCAKEFGLEPYQMLMPLDQPIPPVSPIKP